MTDVLGRADVEGPAPPSAPTATGAPTADPAASSASAPAAAMSPPVPAPLRGLLAALLAGAGAVHVAMAPSHLGTAALEGAGFVAAAWLQLGLAAAVLARTRPPRWLAPAVAAVNTVLIAAWAVSRTAGLPFGDQAGHAESVSVVDGICVALEAAAVGVAVAAALPAVTAGLGRRRGPTLAAGVATVAALALATGAVVSPAARDHAAGSHGDHAPAAAGHDHASADDKGFSELVNGHQHGQGIEPLTAAETATLARQLTVTADLVERYPTLGDARAAGYRRNGPFTPGLGTHYGPPDAPLNGDGDMDPEDLAAPFIIYDGLEPDAPIAGFMYLATGVEPEGFAGPNDHWHHHENVCVIVNPDGTLDSPLAADAEGTTKAACDAIGGQWIDFVGYMVHVWNVPGYESPDGMFTEVNPRITCPDGTYHRIPLDDIVGKDDLCLNA